MNSAKSKRREDKKPRRIVPTPNDNLLVWDRYRVELLNPAHLIPHEEVRPERVDEILAKIRRRNFFHKPILVDRDTWTILDGHHKWTAACALGLRRVPVVAIDYLRDGRIRVEPGEGIEATAMSKEGILLAALRSKRFPPKSSRHILPSPLPRLKIPIVELLFPVPD